MREASAGTGAADARRLPPLCCRDLAACVMRNRGSFRFVTPVLAPEDPALLGRFRLLDLHCGLSLHATDAVDVHDLRTEAEAGPGLRVAVFLRGRAAFSLGDRPYAVDAADGPRLLVTACAEPDRFVRCGTRRNWVRKVIVEVPPAWLEREEIAADGSLARFVRTHGESAGWRPSARQEALAERIVSATPFGAGLDRLYLESHALEIVADALAALGARDAAATRLGTRERVRLDRVCGYLEAYDGDELRLDDVAREAGMSVSALQRLFRDALGTSVFEHYRALRLDRARRLLERDGVSVTEAAFAAGYGNPANFATAFRRRFGVPPSEARRGRCAAASVPAKA